MEDMEDFFVYAILIERSGCRSTTYGNKGVCQNYKIEAED